MQDISETDFSRRPMQLNKTAYKMLLPGNRLHFRQQTSGTANPNPHTSQVALLIFYIRVGRRMVVSVTHKGIVPCLVFSDNQSYINFLKAYTKNVKYNLEPLISRVSWQPDGTIDGHIFQARTPHQGKFCEKAATPQDLSRLGTHAMQMVACQSGIVNVTEDELPEAIWNLGL